MAEDKAKETAPAEKTPAAQKPLPDKKIKEEQEQINQEMIDKANEAAKRIEEANLKKEALIAKENITKQLGGESEAGIPAKTKEEKEIEEAQKLVPKEMLDLSKKED